MSGHDWEGVVLLFFITSLAGFFYLILSLVLDFAG